MEIKPYTGGAGYLAMPLKRNIPNPDPKSNWKEAKCPVCGKECWRTPEHDTLEQKFPIRAVCTLCALTLPMKRESG